MTAAITPKKAFRDSNTLPHDAIHSGNVSEAIQRADDRSPVLWAYNHNAKTPKIATAPS